jgi:hypothetical protein
MIRSILAVLAGLIVIVVTSFGIEAAVDPLMLRMFPETLPNEAALSHNTPVWIFTFAYTFLCVIAGGYVSARLAARSPVRHAVILGLLQSALTIPAMIEFGDKARPWAWIVSMILVVPAAWLGGLIFARRVTSRRAQVSVLA